MFANSKSIAILVNSYTKRHSCLMFPATRNIQSIPYLKHWTLFLSIHIYKLTVLFKTDTWYTYGWTGNAPPFIADLYLSRCEYCYANKLTNYEWQFVKRLSYNWRYLDDICTVNLKDLGTSWKILTIKLWYWKAVLVVVNETTFWISIFEVSK